MGMSMMELLRHPHVVKAGYLLVPVKHRPGRTRVSDRLAASIREYTSVWNDETTESLDFFAQLKEDLNALLVENHWKTLPHMKILRLPLHANKESYQIGIMLGLSEKDSNQISEQCTFSMFLRIEVAPSSNEYKMTFVVLTKDHVANYAVSTELQVAEQMLYLSAAS